MPRGNLLNTKGFQVLCDNHITISIKVWHTTARMDHHATPYFEHVVGHRVPKHAWNIKVQLCISNSILSLDCLWKHKKTNSLNPCFMANSFSSDQLDIIVPLVLVKGSGPQGHGFWAIQMQRYHCLRHPLLWYHYQHLPTCNCFSIKVKKRN